jgi:cell division protein FtsZ
MEGAHGVLLSIYGGSDLGLFEINDAASLVAESAHPDANIIFGAVIDDTLGDEVKVTVIAAGFDSGQLPYKKVDVRRENADGTSSMAPSSGAPASSATGGAPRSAMPGVSAATGSAPSSYQQGSNQPSTNQPGAVWTPNYPPARKPVELDEELDVPDFLK